jgi:hypothetical protein
MSKKARLRRLRDINEGHYLKWTSSMCIGERCPNPVHIQVEVHQ